MVALSPIEILVPNRLIVLAGGVAEVDPSTVAPSGM